MKVENVRTLYVHISVFLLSSHKITIYFGVYIRLYIYIITKHTRCKKNMVDVEIKRNDFWFFPEIKMTMKGKR